MRILIDESLPQQLKQMVTGHTASTVQDMGWAGLKNGELLSKAESNFDAFLTGDKNLRHQQNLEGLRLIIFVLPSNRLKVVQALSGRLKDALAIAKPGEIVEL